MEKKWIGPYRIAELLDNFPRQEHLIPPDKQSVYLVSKTDWKGHPTPDRDCIPLYVGSNTGTSERFRTRIGDLIADMFGFFGDRKTGHHSGGKKLFRYCVDEKLHPKELYIAWMQQCQCVRCEENLLYNQLKACGSLLNKKQPPKCNKHPVSQLL